MAINKKLIHFKSKEKFKDELAKGNILNTSIVFIKESREIWTHGEYYSLLPEGLLTEEEANELFATKEELKNIGEGTITQNISPITWEELKNLRDNSELIPGCWYRITDYRCTTTQDDTQSAGHDFDIIVMATDINKLSEEGCKAIQHQDDEYFANNKLEAWQIWYCLDNDIERFVWADNTNGKGVIYRMIDEFGNDCPYDFKNIQFKRWAINRVTVNKTDVEDSEWIYNEDTQVIRYGINSSEYGGTMKFYPDASNYVFYYTFSWVDAQGEIKDASVEKLISDRKGVYPLCYQNIMKPISSYNYDDIDDNKGVKNALRYLNNNVFISHYGYFSWRNYFSTNGNILENDCKNNTFGCNCTMNFLGNECSSNLFGYNCKRNYFGNKCYDNVIPQTSTDNKFGNYCHENILAVLMWADCTNNIFGEGFAYNCFTQGCVYNQFGAECCDNKLFSCDHNVFGNNCSWNVSNDDTLRDNIFGNNFEQNTLSGYVKSNVFGNDCTNNVFDDGCRCNSFGNEFRYNIIGKEFKFNTIESFVYYITIKDNIRNTYILSGTAGEGENKLLLIDFKPFVEYPGYSQFAGLDSSGKLQIWVPTDDKTKFDSVIPCSVLKITMRNIDDTPSFNFDNKDIKSLYDISKQLELIIQGKRILKCYILSKLLSEVIITRISNKNTYNNFIIEGNSHVNGNPVKVKIDTEGTLEITEKVLIFDIEGTLPVSSLLDFRKGIGITKVSGLFDNIDSLREAINLPVSSFMYINDAIDFQDIKYFVRDPLGTTCEISFIYLNRDTYHSIWCFGTLGSSHTFYIVIDLNINALYTLLPTELT